MTSLLLWLMANCSMRMDPNERRGGLYVLCILLLVQIEGLDHRNKVKISDGTCDRGNPLYTLVLWHLYNP